MNQNRPPVAAAAAQGLVEAPPADDQALAKVNYQPLAPVGSAGDLKSLLLANRNGLAALVAGQLTPEKLIRAMLVAVNKTPAILNCTQASILESINRAAQLGLDITGTLGEAYIVPFKNKVDGNYYLQATLIPGYRGLAKLAWQSGEVKQIEAEPVHEKDHFVYEKGTEPRLEFIPLRKGDRGKVEGYYALIGLKSGGYISDYMTRADVERVRQKANSKNSPAWREHFDEMGRKTVFRRATKWAPLSNEKFKQVVEQDNIDFDFDDLAETIEVTAGQSNAAALADRLAGNGDAGSADGAEPAALEAGVPAEGERLTPKQLIELDEIFARQPVSRNEVEDSFGGPLRDVTVAGLSADELFDQVRQEIAARVKRAAAQQQEA